MATAIRGGGRPLPTRAEVLGRGTKEASTFSPVDVPKDPADASRDRVRMTRNVTNLYRSAPAKTVQQGREWYPKAHDEAVKLGSTLGSGTRTGAGIIAAVSPSMSWENNIPAAHQFGHLADSHVHAMSIANDEQKRLAALIGHHERAAGKAVGKRAIPGAAPPELYAAHEEAKAVHMATRSVLSGTPLNNQSTDNIVKAGRIRSGEAPESVLPQRLKTGNFYRNVNDPSDNQAVTVDTHAHDAARMSKLPFKTDRGLTAVSRYDHFADAYRGATPRVGETHPHVVQAVVWQHWKDNYGNDTSLKAPAQHEEEQTGAARDRQERGIAARSAATVRKHGAPAFTGDRSDPWHPSNQ